MKKSEIDKEMFNIFNITIQMNHDTRMNPNCNEPGQMNNVSNKDITQVVDKMKGMQHYAERYDDTGCISRTLGGFTFDEAFSVAKVASHLSSAKSSDMSVSDILSKLKMYQLNKAGFKHKSMKVNNITIHLIFNEDGILIYMPGMNSKQSAHYRIVLDAILTPCSLIKGRVHSGFYRAFTKIIKNIKSEIHAVADIYNKSASDMSITVSGHSMGGALSYLVGYDLQQSGYSDVRVLTFGAPRVFSPIAAKAYTKLMKGRTLRVTHGYSDFVPGLAPAISGYIHVGAHLLVKCEGIKNMSNRHSMQGYLYGMNVMESESCVKFKESRVGRVISLTAYGFRWAHEIAAEVVYFVRDRFRRGKNTKDVEQIIC